MENNNASSMFNNNNSAHENSFMGDNSSTIVTSPQEKTMNITSPNSSDIDHNIHCLTLPPSTRCLLARVREPMLILDIFP
jgi:hypothetical protein